MGLRRALFLIHRWLGIAGCLLVLAWFSSGVVMLYVPFPQLEPAARLAGLAPLGRPALGLSPAAAAALCPGPVRALRLNRVAGEPVYHVGDGGGWCSISAVDGRRLVVDGETAARQAAVFAGQGAVPAGEAIPRDQWTVYRSYDPHRPLYRFALDDAAGRVLHVSSTTGEVVLASSRAERGWSWVGTVLHWIYFTPLRAHAGLWRDLVLWLSAACLAASLSGLWLGIQRLRLKKPYGGGRASPYRGWKYGHHLLGLGGGVFAATWLFSGWLSLSPFGWAAGGVPTMDESAVLAGGPLQPVLDREALAAALAAAGEVREVVWGQFQGRGYAELHGPREHRRIDGTGRDVPPPTLAELGAAARQLDPAPLVEAARLDEADTYYYNQPLPVVRIRFAGPDAVSYYLDPESGSLRRRVDAADRQNRWLFSALHRLDFPPLASSGLGREILVQALSLAGAGLAASACLLAWRRLRRGRGEA